MKSISKKGGASNKPFKYYRTGVSSGDEESKKPRKSTRSTYGRLFDILVILLLLAGSIYCILLYKEPKTAVGNTLYHSKSDYETAIKKQFASTLNKNKLTLNQDNIVNNLKHQFPEISAVYIHVPIFGHQPKVDISISPPSFKLVSAGNTFVINSDGVLVSQANDMQDPAFLGTINDQSGYINKIGEKVISTQSINFIKDIISQLKVSNIAIESLTIPPVANELYLKTSGSKYIVKFYLGGDSAQQLGQYLAARQNFKKTHIEPKQYLDVRVEGKIFYK